MARPARRIAPIVTPASYSQIKTWAEIIIGTFHCISKYESMVKYMFKWIKAKDTRFLNNCEVKIHEWAWNCIQACQHLINSALQERTQLQYIPCTITSRAKGTFRDESRFLYARWVKWAIAAFWRDIENEPEGGKDNRTLHMSKAGAGNLLAWLMQQLVGTAKGAAACGPALPAGLGAAMLLGSLNEGWVFRTCNISKSRLKYVCNGWKSFNLKWVQSVQGCILMSAQLWHIVLHALCAFRSIYVAVCNHLQDLPLFIESCLFL